jgi:hypothetical protein
MSSNFSTLRLIIVPQSLSILGTTTVIHPSPEPLSSSTTHVEEDIQQEERQSLDEFSTTLSASTFEFQSTSLAKEPHDYDINSML